MLPEVSLRKRLTGFGPEWPLGDRKFHDRVPTLPVSRDQEPTRKPVAKQRSELQQDSGLFGESRGNQQKLKRRLAKGFAEL